jgi:exopolyphosphatase/guanosine-5'-triphosphate,3'-diphosphate pyrophosphatase
VVVILKKNENLHGRNATLIYTERMERKPEIVAAIDVGSSGIRMEISEISADGTLVTLESLNRAIGLGKDTFTHGNLQEETIQNCCQVLADYAKFMKDYNVSRYRAVATSAIREAGNADTFIDRVLVRSGIEIDLIDGSEENRLTYLAIHDAAGGYLDLQTINALVVEVGGGSTDISLYHSGKPTHFGTFALGSVRLQQTMGSVKGEWKQRLRILDRQIKNTIDTIGNSIPFEDTQEFIALGGDIRFAARRIATGESRKPSEKFWILDRKAFQKFATEISRYDTDELVKRFSLTYPQAETLVPALLAYRHIADRTSVEKIYVLSASIREGILLDMAPRASLQSFDEQILASARGLAVKYHSNENHVEQVRKLALSLFDQLQNEHRLGRKERLYLEVAALVHDVGTFVSDRSHHKHTQYIVSSSDIFGLSRSDVNLIANIARYHRKSPPTRSHLPYISLDRESRMIVSKLAAILRIADALDQDYSRKVQNLRITLDEEKGRYILEVEADGDLAMERISLQSKSDLFHQIFGRTIELRQINVAESV